MAFILEALTLLPLSNGEDADILLFGQLCLGAFGLMNLFSQGGCCSAVRMDVHAGLFCRVLMSSSSMFCTLNKRYPVESRPSGDT